MQRAASLDMAEPVNGTPQKAGRVEDYHASAPRQHKAGRGAVQPLVAAGQAAAGRGPRAGAAPQLAH